jgi:hypothetical protein
MTVSFHEQPILNSPYERPKRHWELDPQGQPTQKIIEARRKAAFITPIPKPRKQKGGAKQGEFVFDEGKGLSSKNQQYDEIPIINDLRGFVDAWRELRNPADWHVTPETARLLQHWRTHPFNGVRPFFCQIEALETVIWLTEVAPDLGKTGQRFLEHLANANNDANPELMRLALKLATGAGKTTVMAMLIAWQTINAVRRPGSKRYTRGFLVVAPGLTIRDRLRVLRPNDPDSYYQSREIAPPDMLRDLGRAKIVITNYHAFKLRERMEVSKSGRSLLQGRGDALQTLETEGQMLQRVLPDLMGMKNIMVLNDEAHHCYRAKPNKDDEEELSGDEKQEADKNNEAARLWISGLEAVNRKLGTTRVIDLSATPFFLRGSGYAEGTLFPWVMSDFSLMDAIECGIVKLPRVPVADNIPSGEMPKFRNLWENIRSRMPKKGRAKNKSLDPLSLPVELQTALEALYGHYRKTHDLWKESGIAVPPCFIVVCNNTATSKLVFDYISGFRREHEDGSTTLENGRLELFRNFDEHGNPLPRPNTFLIDSEQLESGEGLDDNFRAMAADEIERFRWEIIERTGDPRRGENISDHDLLREVMNTVGKPGRLGESIRCVVSVSMLTEGWDCLDSETKILTPDGWRGRGEIAPGDAVYSLNRDTGFLEVVPVLEYGERPVRPGERMVRLKSQHMDIRVTEGHLGDVSSEEISVRVADPNGRLFLSRDRDYQENIFFIDAPELPVTGIYTVLVRLNFLNITSNLRLYRTPPDVKGIITPGGAAVPVVITSPGQNAILTFKGLTGQRLSLTANANSISRLRACVQKPDGGVLIEGNILNGSVSSGEFLDIPALPVAGAYSLVLDPIGTNVGGVTVRLHSFTDIAQTIAPNSSARVDFVKPGQNAALTFNGVAGQRVSLLASFAGLSASVSLRNPTGAVINSLPGGFMETTTLPVSGTYTIFIDPFGGATGSVTLALYDVPPDVTGTIASGGGPVTVTVAVPGQNARLTFNGVAGQRVSVTRNGATIAESEIGVLDPNNFLFAFNHAGPGDGFILAARLYATGTHTLVIDPHGANTGSLSVTLHNASDPPGVAIATTGAVATGTTATPGQNVVFTFNGTAGRRMSLLVESTTFSGAVVSLVQPNGSSVAAISFPGGGAHDRFMEPQRLPVGGAYRIVVQPLNGETGSVTLRLYDVPSDASRSMTVGGAAVTATTTVPGQNARLTFNATAGQPVTALVTASALPGAYVTLRGPNGADLTFLNADAGAWLERFTPPLTGTYTFLIDPYGPPVGGVSMRLFAPAADIAPTLSVGGAETTATTTVPGQNIRATFNGTAGQRVSLLVVSSTLASSGGSPVYGEILAPDGTWISGLVAQAGWFSGVLTLPATGTYTVVIDPFAAETGAVRLRLSAVPSDIAGNVVIGGNAASVAISAPGQNAALAFNGMAGQSVTVRLSGNTLGDVWVELLGPDGSHLGGAQSTNGSFTLEPAILSATGTYRIRIDPQSPNVGNIAVTVTTP